MQKAMLKECIKGTKLLPLVKHMSLCKVQEFAVMSQGAGPIHVDAEYCSKTPFKKPLVPGFMISGYVAEMMENNFGDAWFEKGEMAISFVKPAKPGDTLLIEGIVDKLEDNKAYCQISVINQLDDKVAKGECIVQVC